MDPTDCPQPFPGARFMRGLPSTRPLLLVGESGVWFSSMRGFLAIVYNLAMWEIDTSTFSFKSKVPLQGKAIRGQ